MNIVQKLLETLKFEHEYVAEKDNSPSEKIGDFLSDKRTLVLTGYALIVSILTYWFDLTNHTISCDEGWPMFTSDVWRFWFAQGRWSWGVTQYILPHSLGGLPFIATAFCCITFSFSAALLATVNSNKSGNNNGRWEILFVTLFVSCPIFPYSVKFGINSMAVGLCVLFSSLAARLVFLGKIKMKIIALVLLIIATGFYQSGALHFLAAALLLSTNIPCNQGTKLTCIGKHCLLLVSYTLVAFIASSTISQIFVLSLNLSKSSYHDTLIELHSIIPSLGKSLEKVLDIVCGTDILFVNVGISSLAIVWTGVLVASISFVKKRKSSLFTNVFLIFCAIITVISIIFLTSAKIPVRGLTALPVLYAFTGAFATRLISHKFLITLIALLSIFSNIYISTSLFYSDRISRIRDDVMAFSIISRMQEIEPRLGQKKVKFVIIGEFPHENFGIAHKVEKFGHSFLTVGFPAQQEHYFRYLGVKNLTPARLSPAVARKVDENTYPTWPDKRSIFYYGDILVIKLGHLHPWQRKEFGMKDLEVTWKKSNGNFSDLMKKTKINNADSIPVTKDVHIERSKLQKGQFEVEGWAYSKDKKSPISYFIVERNGDIWTELPTVQMTQIERSDVANFFNDGEARLSGFKIRIEQTEIRSDTDYRLIVYFSNSNEIYQLSIPEKIKKL